MNRLKERRLELGLTQEAVSGVLKLADPRMDVSMVSRFENGACLLFETSWALNCRDQSYTQICGTKGGAELEPLCIYTEEDEYLTDKHPVTINIDRFEYEIRHFVDCARTGRKPVSCLEDALTIQRILDAIYRSARENREVSL